MTLDQFHEWMAFAELEPFDETRADVRASSIRSTLAELRRDPKKRAEPFSFVDFLIPFGDEPRVERPKIAPPQQSWQEQKFYAMMFVAEANAATDRRRR
jgi:hypothetical protein